MSYFSILIFLFQKHYVILFSEGVIYVKGIVKMKDGVDANFNKIQSVDGEVDFTMTIQCRDGKYKYTMNNFTHKNLMQKNVFGYVPKTANTNINKFDLGPLVNEKPLIGWGQTGRGKGCWIEIKNNTKIKIYELTQKLKSIKIKSLEDF